MGRYWPDANAFIWGGHDPYPFPGARPYWDWFEKQVDAGKIITHRKVIEEILDGESKKDNDLLIDWVKTRKKKLTAPADTEECQSLVGQLCQYAWDTFGAAKTPEFTKGADLWLVARAKLDGGIVVTQESTNKKVRIPTVCKAFGIKHVSLFQMGHELGMTLYRQSK